MARIGVLALQGGFAAHGAMLQTLGHEPVFVRTPEDLQLIAGLVLPGGESTVQRQLINQLGLWQPIAALVARGCPVLATCAGLVLAAAAVEPPVPRSFAWLDIAVVRNAWGRQADSFEAQSDEGRKLVFVRAPRIGRVGPGVMVLDRFEGEPVLVRQGNLVAATFHPELTADASLHAMLFSVSS